MIYDVQSPLFRSFLKSTGEDRKKQGDHKGKPQDQGAKDKGGAKGRGDD